MKRKQNDLEMLFNEMANTSSTILFRGIMLFPFAAILGFAVTIKLVLPLIHDLMNISLTSDITIFATGVIVSCVIYFLAVEMIYDSSLERSQQKIAKHIMKELQRRGEISTNSESEYVQKKYYRELRKMAEGRKVKD